ncbi:hypothetical protein ASC66_08105 [Leifsonia sp. Root4]|uniref:hypothetical protein n=1 Tax=Leifsonia sp. Root4 TaxID=1736525 RepID=UPI0006F90A62|nr:hypothetical protein [Leifsonia sp. Root4]KQW06440.1 hypothetical protein ASC66_08105 [Leifsonia sp. Root4]
MADDVAELDRYRPVQAGPYWDIIGEFVEEAVADTAATTGRAPRSVFPAAVAFVLWCWQSRGTPLERPRIFRRAVVEQFIQLGMDGYLQGSKATHRATLSQMVRVLNPADAVPAHRPIPRSAPTEPYTPADVAALHSWAFSQGTPRRRNDAVALLALGLGAGLATRELLKVRTSDLGIWNEQMFVIVREGRPRHVPILSAWQQPIRRILGEVDQGDWLFRPGRSSTGVGQIADFFQRAPTSLDVRPLRMRTTWLLHHLLAGTPPLELLRISGLQNFAALDKIAVFIPSGASTPAAPR